VVNVTVAVCPRADAVTVTGCVEGGGWYTTDGPLSPDSVPGTVVDHVTSLAIDTGEAVMVTGPDAAWFPDGLMVSVGWGSLPAQAARITDAAANIRVRIEVSAMR
jgi:hypothetical protein